MSRRYRPRTDHQSLGAAFYDPVQPARFPEHVLRYRNQRAAASVGLDHLTEADWIAHFGRFEPLPGSFDTPLALRYHGHQFQAYNPDLGDGRGFLFAQLEDLGDGRLLDLGTKGSGRTPWSRGADGRLTLQGGLREVLATAMLDALGVPTSRSFSLIETGEELARGDEPSPARSAVLVRLSHGHIRIGTFQRLSFLRDHDNLALLLDFCLRSYFPDLWQDDQAGRAAAFLGAVAEAVARTGARWTAAGFVHGVLNTDNINITGESFDYGPWRFLPTYDPAFTAAYFDQTGLYAFGRQPDSLAWNLTRLAECLLPLGEHAALEAALNRFWPTFQRELRYAVCARLDLPPAGEEADTELLTTLFAFLHDSQAPFEQVFFDWRGGRLSRERARRSPISRLYEDAAFTPLATLLEARPAGSADRLAAPYFARQQPRTMLNDEVRAIWASIAADDDWTGFTRALAEIEEMRLAYAVTDPRPGSDDRHSGH